MGKAVDVSQIDYMAFMDPGKEVRRQSIYDILHKNGNLYIPFHGVEHAVF